MDIFCCVKRNQGRRRSNLGGMLLPSDRELGSAYPRPDFSRGILGGESSSSSSSNNYNKSLHWTLTNDKNEDAADKPVERQRSTEPPRPPVPEHLFVDDSDSSSSSEDEVDTSTPIDRFVGEMRRMVSDLPWAPSPSDLALPLSKSSSQPARPALARAQTAPARKLMAVRFSDVEEGSTDANSSSDSDRELVVDDGSEKSKTPSSSSFSAEEDAPPASLEDRRAARGKELRSAKTAVV